MKFLISTMFIFFTSSWALAQAAPAQPSMLEAFLPMVVLMVLMYFLLIRPQAKKAKDHQKFVTELKRGDEIITTGGILGKIEGLNETVATIEIADGVRVKMLRSQIAGSSKAALETKKA